MGHLLMENRNGLIVDGRVSEANGTAERDEAQAMVAAIPGRHRITVGGDKNFDTAGFVAALQELNATPHVAQNTSNRRSAIDGRTTRHPGYAVSQRIRKRIEEGFGWIKEVALQRRARHRGKDRVGWQFTLAAAAYNLIRLPKLLPRRDGEGRRASGQPAKLHAKAAITAPPASLDPRSTHRSAAIRLYFRSLLDSLAAIVRAASGPILSKNNQRHGWVRFVVANRAATMRDCGRRSCGAPASAQRTPASVT